MPTKQLSIAVLFCGVIDILYAMVLTMMSGRPVTRMLQSVASGPFGNDAFQWGNGGAALGLIVHFAIMAVMAVVFFMLFRDTALGRLSPWLAGALYGLALFAVMHFIVLPLRWPAIYPQTGLTENLAAVFAHVCLVGIPLALIAARAVPATR